MCGRYYADGSTEQKVRQLTKNSDCSVRGGDIRPSEEATIITGSGGKLMAENMVWGFSVQEGRGLLINARAETVTERLAFRDSVLSRRCVIPAKGFYEWSQAKKKYQFEEAGRTLFMAGCYDENRHFVIITTAANESVLPVHGRMPLLLFEEETRQWIQKAECMAAILQKVPQALSGWTPYQQMSFFD